MDLIGNTPLVDITSVCTPKHPDTVVLGKVEFFNPGYSMKDRIMANIFNKAE
jgi:cysteine synthase